MSELYEIIYVSRRSPSVTDHQVIDEVVLVAGRKNRRLDITGCLWFDRFRFLQVIEGPRSEVERVYRSICTDPRHTDIQTISASPIASRSFSRWGMRSVTGERSETIESLAQHYATRAMPGAKPDPAQEALRPGLIGRIRERMVRLTGAEPVPGDPA